MREQLAKMSRPEVVCGHEAQPWSNLEILTFTGLDYRTNLEKILAISERYPAVEFGILAGSHMGEEDHRRYPSIGEIKWWRGLSRKSHHQIAIHLCGRYARGALGQGDMEMDEVLRLCKGFNRVQINASEYDLEKVIAFTEAVECSQVILQRREAVDLNSVLPDPKIEYLFDVSGGQGLRSLDKWPTPAPWEGRSGYAGGLGLHNIKEALDFVASHRDNGRRLWLDMESGVRTFNDWLNTDQIQAICEIVFPDN